MHKTLTVSCNLLKLLKSHTILCNKRISVFVDLDKNRYILDPILDMWKCSLFISFCCMKIDHDDFLL